MSLTSPPSPHASWYVWLNPKQVFASVAKPIPALTLLGCALMMFACVTNRQLGPHAVAFKLHYTQWFMLAAIVLSWLCY